MENLEEVLINETQKAEEIISTTKQNPTHSQSTKKH